VGAGQLADVGPTQGGRKSNEISTLPKLLRALELTGCIVTVDAMGTQKQIAKKRGIRGK
jgi:predicted transposase YbfD/YdcC